MQWGTIPHCKKINNNIPEGVIGVAVKKMDSGTSC